MVTIDKYETFNAGLEYSKEKTRRQNLVKHTNLPEKTNTLNKLWLSWTPFAR